MDSCKNDLCLYTNRYTADIQGYSPGREEIIDRISWNIHDKRGRIILDDILDIDDRRYSETDFGKTTQALIALKFHIFYVCYLRNEPTWAFVAFEQTGKWRPIQISYNVIYVRQ